MKKAIIIFVCLIHFQNFFSQKTYEGMVVDGRTLLPIEFADIYSGTDYTSTNADGRFKIDSKNDSITFRRLGYEKIKTTFLNIENRDTIRLYSIEYELEEVVIKNNETLLKEVFLEIKNNYPYKPYKEMFFLRVSLRRDGEIVKLQDFYGKLERQSLFGVEKVKKNYKIELLSMRKAGLEEKKYDVIFWSFNQLLSELTTIGINSDFFHLKSKPYKDNFYKIEFLSKKGIEASNYLGYYIINSSDNSILEFYSKRISNNSKYKNILGIIKYRTTYIERFITFEKSEIVNKYYVSKFKENLTVEVIVKKETKPIIYDYSYILTTKNNFGTFKVTKNISSKKDMFKLKHKYEKSFWNNQKQLLLTKEMRYFLEKVKSSEFKVITNLE